MERPGRTLLKAIIWNINGRNVMSGVGYATTGAASIGGAMAAVNTAIGPSLYVVYERIWSRIAWGRADA